MVANNMDPGDTLAWFVAHQEQVSHAERPPLPPSSLLQE